MAVVIKDVAREAGLAISTISKYMNGGKVREENQQRIENAIEKLGYRPNEFARGLKGASTHTIGIVVHNFKDVFSAKMVGYIERNLRSQNYSIILTSHEGSREREKESVSFLLEKQVDGIILEPVQGSDTMCEWLLESKKPVLAVDRPLDMKLFDSVTSNTMLGVYEGVEYLISKGHRGIAMLSAGRNETRHMVSGIERLKGFRRGMEDYGLAVRKEWVIKGDFSYESGYKCMKELWCCKEHPTAVVVANYCMCMGMMKAIHELKIEVPKDLSVISVDDMVFTQICNPGLSAIRQPIEEIALKTSEIIIKRINGDYGDFPQNLKLHTKLIERGSVRRVDAMPKGMCMEE